VVGVFDGKRVGVVIPAYNEAGFVGDVIDEVPEFVDRVYAVDDGSTDGTLAEIRESAERCNADPRRGCTVTCIEHVENRGVGGAIKTGYTQAYTDGMDVVAVLNADGQTDPAILDRFVAPVAAGDADYAKGNRLANRSDRALMSTWRTTGNYLLSFLNKFASGYWQSMDPQNGYTAVSRDAIERIGLDDTYERFGFLNDLLVRCNVHDVRVVDVPMRALYGDETSHIRYSSFIPEVSWLLVKRFVWRLTEKHVVRGFHPLVVWYLFAAVAFVASLVATVATGAAALGAFGGAVGSLGGAAVLSAVAGAGSLATAVTLDHRANDDLHLGYVDALQRAPTPVEPATVERPTPEPAEQPAPAERPTPAEPSAADPPDRPPIAAEQGVTGAEDE
jgi:glycosyltransferase involved in cell wall biosynthesis